MLSQLFNKANKIYAQCEINTWGNQNERSTPNES